MKPNLTRRLVAEALGTAILLATVIGSGIMGERLAGGNIAVALLANTIATGAVLVALILTFGCISGAFQFGGYHLRLLPERALETRRARIHSRADDWSICRSRLRERNV